MGCNASKIKFERGPQETDDKAKPNNESKGKNTKIMKETKKVMKMKKKQGK